VVSLCSFPFAVVASAICFPRVCMFLNFYVVNSDHALLRCIFARDFSAEAANSHNRVRSKRYGTMTWSGPDATIQPDDTRRLRTGPATPGPKKSCNTQHAQLSSGNPSPHSGGSLRVNSYRRHPLHSSRSTRQCSADFELSLDREYQGRQTNAACSVHLHACSQTFRRKKKTTWLRTQSATTRVPTIAAETPEKTHDQWIDS